MEPFWHSLVNCLVPIRNLDVISVKNLPAILMAMLWLASCSVFSSPPATVASTKGQVSDVPTEIPPDVFTVPDIPIPPGASVLKEDTVIVGADEDWTGQVVLHAPYRVAQMTEFYRKEMPRFAWSETSIVRARRTAISFNKDLRVVIVRISARSETESEIDIVVSPNFAGTPTRTPRPPSGVPQPRAKPSN